MWRDRCCSWWVRQCCCGLDGDIEQCASPSKSDICCAYCLGSLDLKRCTGSAPPHKPLSKGVRACMRAHVYAWWRVCLLLNIIGTIAGGYAACNGAWTILPPLPSCLAPHPHLIPSFHWNASIKHVTIPFLFMCHFLQHVLTCMTKLFGVSYPSHTLRLQSCAKIRSLLSRLLFTNTVLSPAVDHQTLPHVLDQTVTTVSKRHSHTNMLPGVEGSMPIWPLVVFREVQHLCVWGAGLKWGG